MEPMAHSDLSISEPSTWRGPALMILCGNWQTDLFQRRGTWKERAQIHLQAD
jgi:hypothetical protein